MKRLACILLTAALLFGIWLLPAAAASEYRTWLQSDSRWGSISFGSSGDTMSKSGCAITSIAKLMVHSGAVSADPSVFHPGIYCNWLKNNGAITSQGWIVWSAAANYTSKFSYYGAATLSGTQAQKTATIKSYVDDGYVVVAMVKDGGHYVAVDKVSGGTVYIMDPANTGYTKLFQYTASGVTKIQIYKGVHNGSGSNTPSSPTYDTSVQPVGAGPYMITSSDGVNLRSGAGTSYGKLTAIPYGTQVRVTKVDNGWGYTKYDGKTGWFSLTYAKMTSVILRGLQVTAPTKRTYYIGEKLDTAGMKVTALYGDGSSKTLTGGYTVSGFASDKTGSCTVYVTYQTKSAVFTVTVETKPVVYQPGIYTVDSDNGLNLRSQPSTDGTVITAMPDNTRLTVTEIRNNWGKTVYGTDTGWVCLDYTRFVGETAGKPVGIRVTAKQPNILSGSSVGKENFIVTFLYDDKTTAPATAFTIALGTISDDRLPVTVTAGEFSQTVMIGVYDRVPLGDCDFSGKVDASDALAVLRAAVGKMPASFWPDAADVTGDGKVDANDALWILQLAVGKIDSFQQQPTPTDVTATD